MNNRILKGQSEPLGATLTSGGVNFALYSHDATDVHLLLFDKPNGEPTEVIIIQNCTRYVWHCFVSGLKAGQLYAYRVFGEYNPARGLRFNPNKVVMDPYAKALTGKFVDSEGLLYGYDVHSMAESQDLSIDTRDNSQLVPKCVVVDDRFDWAGDAPPSIPFEKLIIYEAHIKGYTAHASSRVRNRGTYLGFIRKIPHLVDLGVNAVQFLPVQEFVVAEYLKHSMRTDYWGFSVISFFAPESSYGTGSYIACQVHEFKTLVRELHRAGIEVILDVPFTFTAEGNERGPTLCFRGVDNKTYYLLNGTDEKPKCFYVNNTGCGNTIDFSNRQVIRFVLDSLRYWVEAMHVDGFVFDQAAELGKVEGYFMKTAPFFAAVSQDPVLSRIKLIAEPYSAVGTYEAGNFPEGWFEWNGRYLDTVRSFLKGDSDQQSGLSWRLAGSIDLYGDDVRSGRGGVNFITCHSGFTLNDLVSYNVKHNEANGEDNRDGTDNNLSWNCGIEGPTDDPEVLALRRRQVKNYICLLLFSIGTPMILGGDEFLRTQQGNNNAYCQTHEITWFNWEFAKKNHDVLTFFKKAIAFRKRYTIFQQLRLREGSDIDNDGVPDFTFFGTNLDTPRWEDPHVRTLCIQLAREDILFLILNSDHQHQFVKIPPPKMGLRWFRVIDTSLPAGDDFMEPGHEIPLEPSDHYLVNPRSTVILLAKGK